MPLSAESNADVAQQMWHPHYLRCLLQPLSSCTGFKGMVVVQNKTSLCQASWANIQASLFSLMQTAAILYCSPGTAQAGI